MNKGFPKVAVFIAAAYLLWYFISAIQASARETHDRYVAVEVAMFLLVLAAPVLSYTVRNRRPWIPSVLLVVQVALYVIYERGVSKEMNIRADLLFAYPAILLNAWIALRAASPNADPSEPSDANLIAVPSDRTKCDSCGADYPSSYYLTASRPGAYICHDCSHKQ